MTKFKKVLICWGVSSLMLPAFFMAFPIKHMLWLAASEWQIHWPHLQIHIYVRVGILFLLLWSNLTLCVSKLFEKTRFFDKMS